MNGERALVIVEASFVSSGPTVMMPALLISTSSPPKASTAAATARSAVAASPISPVTVATCDSPAGQFLRRPAEFRRVARQQDQPRPFRAEAAAPGRAPDRASRR